MKCISFFAAALASTTAYAASLTQVTNFGANPTKVGMFVYKPDRLAINPPVIVALHYCTGTAQAYYSGTQYHHLADQLGFIVIYPNAPDSGGCWDVHTNATLTHNAGGDSLGVVSMVRYAISTWGADAGRVYATGTSSGAMMTDVLMGAYPDVFQAGSLFSGVPYGCFAGPNLWNNQCATGQLILTGEQWGDTVRSGYPSYTGPRPRVQVWHGTADTTLHPQNYYEEVKQWTNVFNVSTTSTQALNDSSLPGYTRFSYGPDFQAILAQGVGHTVPERANDVIAWFGLTGGSSSSASSSSTASPSSSTSPTSSSSSPASSPTFTGVPHWGQCGGRGYTGPTVCAPPYTCLVENTYFSNCL